MTTPTPRTTHARFPAVWPDMQAAYEAGIEDGRAEAAAPAVESLTVERLRVALIEMLGAFFDHPVGGSWIATSAREEVIARARAALTETEPKP